MAFRDLADTLKQLHQLYDMLYEIGLEKKEHIIQNRINELTACTSKESKIVKQIAENESARRNAVIQLQRDLGVRPRFQMSLTELVRMVIKPEEKQELTELQQQLSETVEKLRKLNELNQQLIQQSLEYVDFSLDAMFGPEDEEVVYKKPTMQQQGAKRTGLFDSRI